MKRGFTLIELMGVIIILALLIFLAMPSIINFLKSSHDNNDKINLDLIYSAAETYIRENKNDFPREENKVYCIPLKDLVEDGKLRSPIKLSTGDEDITETQSVEVTFGEKTNYALKSNCVETDGGAV